MEKTKVLIDPRYAAKAEHDTGILVLRFTNLMLHLYAVTMSEQNSESSQIPSWIAEALLRPCP